MRRNQPPPLATWMLEHCIPRQRDDALAGDLLEAFQSGRSNGWYWRQTLAAWAVGWATYIGNRSSLLVFAALWSMLAPAWTAVVDQVENGSVAWPVSVAAWLGMNLLFLWSGMILFAAIHRAFVGPIHAKKLRRSFAVAAGVFLPSYFSTFILMNLFAWPGFEIDRHGMTPLHEIADFRMWADALRIPYFVTILWALWGAAPVGRRVSVAPIEWRPPQGAAAGPLAGIGRPDAYTIRRMLAFMLAAGLLNALIAGFLLCRLPDAHHPTLGSLMARAAAYVAIGALAGVMGTYLYWHYPSSPFRTDPPLPFSLFATVCAAAWVWVPAMVLFAEQESSAAALVAMAGTLMLAGELRRIGTLAFSAPEPTRAAAVEQWPLFAESLYRAPAEAHGYTIAFALYGAGWAIAERSVMTACLFLALGAAVFAWQRTHVREEALEGRREVRRAARRLALAAIPAVLVTMWALMDGVAHRNRLLALNAAMGGNADSGSKDASKGAQGHGTGGFVSVILWPYPEKKQISAPIEESSVLAPGSKRPVVIRFDGQYWYMQPPDQRPGPLAHQAHGTPLDTHIASNNRFPLTMEAHQFLGAPIRVLRCRGIEVEIENRDNDPGAISMAVLLRDSSSAGTPAVYLGEQPIVTSEPGNFRIKSAPVAETLRFAVPAQARVRKFDEITVMILPDAGHQRVGPRIGIDEFALLPR